MRECSVGYSHGEDKRLFDAPEACSRAWATLASRVSTCCFRFTLLTEAGTAEVISKREDPGGGVEDSTLTVRHYELDRKTRALPATWGLEEG